MAKKIDLVGKRYGRWTVLEQRKNESVKWPITYWLCRCDCGTEKLVCGQTLKNGESKSCGCWNRELRIEAWSKNGEHAPKWKGGRFTDKKGYVSLYNGHGKSRIQEHRKVMENYLMRELLEDETVHHINGVRNDNRIENLELWSSSHPPGQRVEDKVRWAKELLKLYSPESLRD